MYFNSNFQFRLKINSDTYPDILEIMYFTMYWYNNA